MAELVDEPWQRLFGSTAAGGEMRSVEMRLLRRHGRPFLLMPPQTDLGAKSLELYAPQTRRARIATSVLRAALKSGLSVFLERAQLRVASDDPFAGFLGRIAGSSSGNLPSFGLLAGNPRVEGQRYLFLLFGSSGEPVAVVKAGTGSDALRLIEREEIFLKSVPTGTRGIPAIKAVFDSERVRAFALDFFPGDSPVFGDVSAPGALLSSWVEPSQTVTVGELSAWRRLSGAIVQAMVEPLRKLAETRIHPAIYHGDFAPWNARIQGGNWTLLDWERGELAGMPLWDWLHFIVQPAVLVEGASTGSVLTKLEEFFRSAACAEYAKRAAIVEWEKSLALAYFHYCVQVVRQTEGLPQIQALAEAAERRWFSGVAKKELYHG